MKIIRDWPRADNAFTDEEKVAEFKSLLASRERLADYIAVGIKQTAGTSDFGQTVTLCHKNNVRMDLLKKKIEYYSQPKEDQR